MVIASRPLIVGNWKMQGLRASIAEMEAMARHQPVRPVDICLCPPFTLLEAGGRAIGSSALWIGAQDCAPSRMGAHTGDIAAEQLADMGVRMVILGHSERRADHGETNAVVRAKAEAVLAAGLEPLICVGETARERDTGATVAVILAQLAESLPEGEGRARCTIAYEPVWAIGTGRTPTGREIIEAHAALRGSLGMHQTLRILYGGSVKPGNAAEILALSGVDGALVGGASLTAKDFVAIIDACP